MTSFYRDRLGVSEGDDPKEGKRAGLSAKSKQAYEESLSKFKDERDAIQKKTFTKWVNKHLKKANRHVNDLFVDLQDGLNLISLLEVLSGEHLHREKGNMRFHMLQNVELVLNFLRYKKIKLVNIRPEDIVDGNPKLTLGLIWTIILHFQISDIVVGEEPNVSAKDVLLRWAKRSTSKYPGVRVADFTQSWRDGLAFNAIIHRNRPDLVDWRSVRQRTVRERLETAFSSAEKVGVTRLLDPEDVDRHEIDEKSIITYISSLYDVFPEPPPVHPLYDSESQALISEYREVSSTLHLWLREKLTVMTSRSLPSGLQELKRLSQESARFKTEEVPPRQRDKAKVQQMYRELQKYFEAVGEVEIEPELHVEVLERNWNRLMVAHQERDQLIQEEIKKYERLQRLGEKVTREAKRVEGRLDDVETRLGEEARRAERLHPLDAKANADALEAEMRATEEAIASLTQDVQTLKAANYHHASELHKKVSKIHQRWVSLRSMLHTKLIARLASVSFPVVEERTVTRQSRTVVETRLVETDANFKNLQQATDWCKNKLKQLEEAEYGTDVATVKSELSHHQREHKEIDQFHTKVDQCAAAKANLHGEELSLYTQHLNTLHKVYAELLSLSNKRLSDLESLLDLVQSAQVQLSWLAEREQAEVARDWSDKDANVPALEQYYESTMSQLEKREVSVRSVMERGESLLLQGHPAAKAVESVLNTLQSQWAHVLQLTLALETHLKTTAFYQAFHRDLRELAAWIESRDELLNTTYSASEFTLDEGERLLKGMQDLREELNSKSPALAELAVTAQQVSPIRQRRLPVARPMPVHAVCNYKHHGVEIEKGDRWLLHDNSALTKWRVSPGPGGADTNVPGVVFLIPPPDREALDALDRLSRSYERTLSLWQRKQLRMRQNMIFATIRVVRSWDLAQFVAMGSEQRNAIRRALNEDAEKLLSEGDPSDPQLRRLRREMDEVNRLFDEFERRARQEEENKNAMREFSEQASSLQSALDEAEKTLNSRLGASIPRDVHSLEHLVIQHKEFETTLKGLTPEVETLQATFRTIPRKSAAMQASMDAILKQWNSLWNCSHLYVERLKCVEIVLASLDEATNVVSELEMKLASFGDMPSELEPLQNMHDDLIRLQNMIASQQPVMDQVIDDATNTRRVVVKSRERLSRKDHADLDRMDDDVNAVTTRWNNLCTQLVERLRSAEAAYGLLENYGKTYQTEVTFIDEAYSKLNNLPPVTHAKHHIEPTKVLFTSIVERTQPLEQVNIDGGRFIREAKIHDARSRRWVEETARRWSPSVDAARRVEPRRGEAALAQELDDLNRRFLRLAAVARDRLAQAALAHGDAQLFELVKETEPIQLKTFRTEFSLFESTTTDVRTTFINTCEVDSMGNKVNGESKTLMRKRRIEEGIGTEVIDLEGIVHPTGGQMMTVGEAIRLRVLDVRTGRLRIGGGESVTIAEAVERGLVEAGLGARLLGPIAGGMTLLEAIQREITEAERGAQPKQAMEEKYKLCDETLRQLLEWMSELEDRLANQDVAAEDLELLKNQINVLKLTKEEVDSQQRTVSNCLDEIRVVVSTGSEYLTRDEVAGLERSGKSLRTRFDRARDTTERLLRRLGAAHDELAKFRSELNTLGQWMDKAERTLDDREKSLTSLNRVDSSDAATKDFVSDVIAHQADLRFITMAAQKFFDESKEYLLVLNELRTSLPSRLSHVEPGHDSKVRGSVASTTSRYRELLDRANRLADRVSGVGGRQREYSQALDRFRQWFSSAEPKANKVVSEPLAADPHALEDQLSRTKALNTEFLSQSRLLDNLKQSVEGLVRSVEGQVSASEIAQLEAPVKELSTRYERLCTSLAERATYLESAIVQSQGVEDALDSVVGWLTSAENSLKLMSRPASLQKERLDDQMRELKVLLADIDSHRGGVDSVSDQARGLVNAATNPRLAKRIETKLRDVVSRFEKLCEKCSKRADFLAETSSAVVQFSSDCSELERWLSEALEKASTSDMNQQSRLDDVAAEKNVRKEQVDRTLRDGRALVAKKDVTDTTQTRDRIKNLEGLWRELGAVVEEKQRVGRARQEQSLAYDKLKDQVMQWLVTMETKISRLDQVAVHMDTIKKQADELKPLTKEHRDYGLTIDKLFDLGNSLDSLARPESPTRRRSSVSPVKRSSVTPLVRRTSHDGSPSPTKSGYSLTSPISPGGSSGFGSRRSSQEAFHLEELTSVQQELTEVNNRYSLVGVKLSDRQAEIDATREELRRAVDHLRTLDSFLDRIARTMPRETLPPSKEDADKTNKIVKGILEEMYEKQSLLESTKSGVNELIRRKPSAVGAEALGAQLSDVTARWKNLNDACKNRIGLLEDVKDLHESEENVSSWLAGKERMIAALGPICSDPRLVSTQMAQVQVLREETRAAAPQLAHLEALAASVFARLPREETETTAARLRSLVQRWNDLAARLEERGASLGAAVDSTREFDAGLGRLRDALSHISDEVDAAGEERDPEEMLRKVQACERQLDGVRPLLADLEAAGDRLCEVLSDPASRAEITAKLNAVNKQYNALQAKLDQRKAEIEATLRDGREFDATCARTLGWLTEELNSMPDRLQVSADREMLQQQLDNHEPIYREVLNKEHEIIMLLDRARERGNERQIESVKQQWERLKREAVDRHTRLQTCMEHCKKYYRSVEGFIPWLSQAENKLDSLRPDSFTKRDVEKHLRELSAFRNEVWKKSGEFEHLRSLGETFLGACDIDKEMVKQELAAIKARWDKLNNELMTRMSNLEEVSRRLGELTDKLRDLGHSVQRCEDRLASHDALGGAANDPAMINTLKSVKEDSAAIRKPLSQLVAAAGELECDAAELGLGRSSLSVEAATLAERLDDLDARLDDRTQMMMSAASDAARFNEKLKMITVDLSSLEAELDSVKPPGRDIPTLTSQTQKLDSLLDRVVGAVDSVAELLSSADALVDRGLSREATRKQAEAAVKQAAALEERTRARRDETEAALRRIEDFSRAYAEAMADIDHLNDELRRLKPVGSEVETIRSQQEEFGRLEVEPVARAVEEVNVSGRALVGSAAAGVSTTQLERDLERINDKWNTLKEKLHERGRKLDAGLLQSGKFQEALDGLNRWLTDTEEMVANQRPPSADYKVVKAQLQEQKFLKKMLVDRQGSMSSLVSMGTEVAAACEDPSERAAVERELSALGQRFDTLQRGAAARTRDLEEAMAVAKEFQDRLTPVLDWLDATERRLREMELVPTDEERIQHRIREHDSLHNEILRKKPALTELTETGSRLTSLVGDDDATGVADRVSETADRYAAVVESSEALGELLRASRAGLRHLVLTYQQLQAWMDGAEQRLARYRVLAVHTDKLLQQMDDLADLTEEIANHQTDVDSTVDSGLELMKHISNDEAIQLKDKLDSLQRRYNDLTTRGADLLKHTQEALPLVQQFHNSHSRLVDWMMGAESQLQAPEPREEDINRLEQDLQEFRPVLENINQVGPQLCGLSPGEGAATIEGLVTRDNRRFDSIAEQIQRKAERLHLSKQRSLEVLGDIDSLLEWFREVEAQLREAEPPSSEPNVIRLQLKEHKALNDDIASQKGRVRDVLATAKKVVRESSLDDDASLMRDKMSDLREAMESVWSASGSRLSSLEEALGLAEHLVESHGDLAAWLTDLEAQVRHLPLPAIRPDLIAHQQDRTEMLLQSLSEHKPLVDKLNKTGEALARLVAEDEAAKVQEMVESDNARYAALRQELKARQETLEKALQESSQFSDKLEGMLRALANTAEEVQGAEPVSAHVAKIKQQQKENQALVDDLRKREEAFRAVRRAAHDVIAKAPDASDPQVKDVKRKLERLNSLWEEVQEATRSRGRSLDDALAVAARFWSELQSVMATLSDLEASLASQEPPAVRPSLLDQQRRQLEEIRSEMEGTKPEVEVVRKTGASLMSLVGEPDKPEVRKHMEDLDTAWDTVTALFAKREENLVNAMEKAMEFHETLQDLLAFLEKAEDRFARLGPLGSDISTVKQQISELKSFKSDVDPHMVKVEALNRQAQELTERTSAEQAAGLKDSLAGVNARWDELHRGVAERNRQLENALLRLGQFHHALAELVAWIDATEAGLDSDAARGVAADPQVLEVELARLRVVANDVQAHRSSVDTLNDAGRQIVESARGTAEASTTQEKLNDLNRRWKSLIDKTASRQADLEEALKEAQRFAAEIQDLLSWLGEVDGVIAASKPVGGLPETAAEQLERFMDVYNELEHNRPKVEAVVARGQEHLRKASGGSSQNLQANLKTLKTRWDSVTARANDKRIKLEIALKEATEFHDALQAFVDWLTSGEKTLTNVKPVSRVLETILGQIEEHKAFQKEVGAHRETMIQLDKKGTHLKYFSQKQDVILIKNLLISVQHRWERVVSKSAERTRGLDHGYKEAKEFHDAWSGLMSWLEETDRGLDEVARETEAAANDPQRLKAKLAKHRETQKQLAAKQPQYDSTLRAGKTIRERAPKSDEVPLKAMVSQLKDKWNTVCSKAVDRQRKLEEALLYCGQFKDALEALLDWLKKTNRSLTEDRLVHGDLDTVNALVDQHKVLEAELKSRSAQMESVERSGRELAGRSGTDGQALRAQMEELTSLWDSTNRLASQRSNNLLAALREAEELHKAVHMLLEWLSDAEMKLRFVDNLPDDEFETRNQMSEHEKFMREMRDKEHEKDSTLSLAERILAKAHPDGVTVIRHWITIIQSRWEEVSTWARQRETRLGDHLRSLQDLDTLLEELLAWLADQESILISLEHQPLPKDMGQVKVLIEEHQVFMEKMAVRQTEVDAVCKAKQQKVPTEKERKMSGKKTSIPRDESRQSTQDLHELARKPSLKSSRDNLGTLDRKSSRGSPGRDVVDTMLPHIGPRFPPKGSKGSEPSFRSPRARLLYDRWRSVWLMAWERQRRLQEMLINLEEQERLANFTWDDWRKRFLRFMNHKKSRLTDLFRKMDKNNDNLIPREDFIEGIIKTKFDTNRPEMGAVADMFDHNSEGVIDWKEFIAALRPDWEEKRPLTEAEKIHDEVKRLVMLCTCRQKFRVFQVGEGKYRFGDSQKLRLVRILRSTVMVRVGGGWVALDEFLVKNDPCRAKGRTNIELREQFILADGVSQSMSAFKPKTSTPGMQSTTPSSAATGGRSFSTSSSSQGPITKVRERSSRSVPMARTCRTPGSVDSLSDNEPSSSPLQARTPSRKLRTPGLTPGGSLPGSRNSSRPASRQGSKPPSRHGSTLSLASSDDGTPSRIPRRSVPARSSGTTTPTTRKLTVPAVNGRSKSPATTPKSSMQRASSIPTLGGSASRGRTTPTSSSKLVRRESNASDTSRKDTKAPFKL